MSIELLLRESDFPGNTTAYQELVSYAEAEQIIGFTGAGVSAPTFPTWARLLNNLVVEAKAAGVIDDTTEYEGELANDPLELASALEDAFTKRIFRAKLAKVFSNRDGTATDCQIAIASLRLRGIVTLNYDSGHEAAYSLRGLHANAGRSQDQTTLTRWLQGDIFEGTQVPVLHLHGEVSDPDQMIFTGDDYNRFYSLPLPESLITQLWRTQRLLVIGFGFTDPFLTRLAEGVLRNIQSDVRHFALIGRRSNESVSSLQRRIFAKKYRLTPIYYQIRESRDAEGNVSEDHSDLNSLLRSLPIASEATIDVHRTNPTGTSLSITTANSVSTLSVGNAQEAQKEFERDLFVSPLGGTLYVEPRLTSQPTTGDFVRVNQEEITSLKELIADTASYIIAAQPEHGATTLAKRLSANFASASTKALVRDASLLPNYKRKLNEGFAKDGIASEAGSVLILDNFDFNRDERLLKELIGLDLFARIIVLARI
jgi:hypothetical protein